jgi:hypothetical protein|eukprot:7302110-Prymnesium_polylepis.1
MDTIPTEPEDGDSSPGGAHPGIRDADDPQPEVGLEGACIRPQLVERDKGVGRQLLPPPQDVAARLQIAEVLRTQECHGATLQHRLNLFTAPPLPLLCVLGCHLHRAHLRHVGASETPAGPALSIGGFAGVFDQRRLLIGSQ